MKLALTLGTRLGSCEVVYAILAETHCIFAGNVTSAPPGSTTAQIAQQKPSGIGNRVRILRSHVNCRYSSVEVFEMIDLLPKCDPGFELGWLCGTISGTEWA